ncbi:MAG: hypothetical protein Q9212_007499 [Teloschistes hypoglaucus]
METSTPKRRKISSIPFTPSSGIGSSAAKVKTVKVSTPKEEIAVSPAKTNGIQYFSVSYKTTSSASRDRISSGLQCIEANGTPSRRGKLNAKERVIPRSRFAVSTGKTALMEDSPTSREPGSKGMEIRKPSIRGSAQQAVDGMTDHSSDDLAISPADANSNTTPKKITPQARKVAQHETTVKAPLNSQSAITLSEAHPYTPKRRQLEDTNDGEPTLPLTPVQLGLEAPSPPPSGLSNFSVSRRSKIKYRSSPLKPKDEVTGDFASSPIHASRSPSVQVRKKLKSSNVCVKQETFEMRLP